MEQWYSVLKSTEKHLVKLLLKKSEKVVSSLNNEFETLLSSFPKDSKVERDHIAKRVKKIVRSLQDKRIKKWEKFESNSFKYDSESRNNVDNRFKFVNFTDRVQRKSKIKTNGSQPEDHVKAELTSSSNVTFNTSSNQLEIPNILEVADMAYKNVNLLNYKERWRQIWNNLMKKNHIATNFKDSDSNNEETDAETQTVANMTISNRKNDPDISNNKKYVFPNVSYANIWKQTSDMRTP